MTEANTVPVPPDAEPGRGPSPSVAQDLKDGAAVALAVAFSGILLGLLWVWLAPRVHYVSNGEAVFLADTENEGRIGADGTFFLISLGLGLLAGGLTFWRLRRGGVAVVVGLAFGSLLAALLGWRLGVWLGPSRDVVAAAKAAGKGVPFDAPLQLLAYGVLLVWPMAAVGVHLASTALLTHPEPKPPAAPADWYGYPTPGSAPSPGSGAPTPGSGAPAPVSGSPAAPAPLDPAAHDHPAPGLPDEVPPPR
ncbi:hypothetical protein [Streptomyces sp. NPDC089919]|uniref:hypothetical protein n=1 Tax=Streptomyces sp. NPDC089919 TaxID=3155188 RepID=UPI003414A020